MWEKAKRSDYPEILSFLTTREWGCVSLTSRLRDSGFPSALQLRHHGQIRIRRDEGAGGVIRDLIYEGSHGLLIPVLHSPETGESAGIRGRPDIGELYAGETPYLFSLIGLRRDTMTLEHALVRKPVKSINYHLMTLDDSPGPADSDHDSVEEPRITLRRAHQEDAPALFPLQREYEKEEVLLDPSRFDPDSSMIMLRETLRNGIVVLAELDGQPVAKAGTNGIGFTYAQIGGVFTEPSLRNRHIGLRLMRFLVRTIAGEGYRSCLFVKYENASAIALYRRLGFITRDDFRISYYS